MYSQVIVGVGLTILLSLISTYLFVLLVSPFKKHKE